MGDKINQITAIKMMQLKVKHGKLSNQSCRWKIKPLCRKVDKWLLGFIYS